MIAAASGLDEHVRGLHVAMHKPLFVRPVQGIGDLIDDPRRAHGIKPALSCHERLEVRAPDEVAWR